MHFLQQKNILVGITGGIAAYKSIELIRLLREAGANVRVVVTKDALAFVTPLTLQTISGHRIYSDILDPETESAMSHIELARWADLLVIAPATANSMAKLAHGFADDLLTTLCLATTARIAIVPAMNQQMWSNPATQHNHDLLKKRGFLSWGPAIGKQACGEYGPGRMIEPSDIINEVMGFLAPKIFQGQHIVITAGPTLEAIDPVRFLSNQSSGKMGYALAQAALDCGAKVTLISGPTHLIPPCKAQVIHITSAQEMYEAVHALVHTAHIFIAVAAVADFRPRNSISHKIKKHQLHELLVESNPDIIQSITELDNPPFTVGFAAETEHLLENATTKLQRKRLDMIVANLVGGETEGGFMSDLNAVSVMTSDQKWDFTLRSKRQLAYELVDLIAQQFAKKLHKELIHL